MTNTTSSKPTITKVVWYDPVENLSPIITPDPASPHMAFNCCEAEGPDGNTVALYAGYNLGWPYLDLYGGQLPAPINLVAMNLFTGDTYFSPCYFSKNSLQKTVQLYMSEATANDGPPARNGTFENAWFNVDLPSLLNLPPDNALYGVSLWLDDVITPIQVVDVGTNLKRHTPATTDTLVQDNNLVNIQTSSHAPASEEGVITMQGPLPEARNYIYGTLPDNVFSSPPTPVEGTTPAFTLMGFTQRSRRFFWYQDTNFFNTAQKNKTYNFSFDPFRLISRPSQPENIFVVSQLGTIRSESLWIPSEQTV